MSYCVWSSKANHVVLTRNDLNVFFDGFEVEAIEATLWVYQGSVTVAALTITDENRTQMMSLAKRMQVLGATNLGEPLNAAGVAA
ncbi:hypothetical protein [Vibrio vulnificus]|uniref:hypothetical protein n=1 Tax=Vibrio vulnificus TaxID=672 RepID=UPI003D9CB0CA